MNKTPYIYIYISKIGTNKRRNSGQNICGLCLCSIGGALGTTLGDAPCDRLTQCTRIGCGGNPLWALASIVDAIKNPDCFLAYVDMKTFSCHITQTKPYLGPADVAKATHREMVVERGSARIQKEQHKHKTIIGN